MTIDIYQDMFATLSYIFDTSYRYGGWIMVRNIVRVVLFVLATSGVVLAPVISPAFAGENYHVGEKFQTPEPPGPPDRPVIGQISGPMSGHDADHSKFKILKGPFADSAAVTTACLTCHTEAQDHIKKTIHWTWSYKDPRTGQMLGKENIINILSLLDDPQNRRSLKP